MNLASNNEAKIRFTAETAEFTQAVRDATSEMSTLRAELQLNEAQFQNTGDSAEYLQKKSDLLQQQLEANRDKQEALTQKLEAAKTIYGDNSTEVERLERQLISARTEEEKIKSQINETNSALEEQSDAAGAAGDSIGDSAGGAAEALTNAGIAAIVKEIADETMEMAQAFDEAKAAIVEGTGASGQALNGLVEDARAAFTGVADANASLAGTSEILAELYTRFGVTGDRAADLTVKIANFAQHTGTDGVKAVDSIADIMKRWNLDLEDADILLDDLTTASQSCQMSVDELTGYLTTNSTQFQELGYSTSEALAMLISLSDGGANVSTVMTGMRQAVSNLSEASGDVPGAFRQAIDAIADCDNVSEALQAQVGDTGLTIEDVFGTRAAQELATNVLNGCFSIEEWTQALEENDGALEQTTANATTMQDKMSQAANNVSTVFSGMFSPAISAVVGVFAGLVTKIAQVVQANPALQAVITALVTGLGALAVALGISSAIKAVTAAMQLMNLTMMANPIVLIVAAIAALVAAILYLWTNCEGFRNAVIAVWEAVKTAFHTAISAITAFLSGLWNTMQTIWNGIVSVVQIAIGLIASILDAAFQIITLPFRFIWENCKDTIMAVWDAIRSAVSTAIDAVSGVISSVMGAIQTVISTIWTAIYTKISTVFNAIRTTASTVWNAIKSAVSSVVNAIKTVVSSAFTAVRTTVTTIWNAIKTAITTPVNAAKTAVKSAIDAIKGFFNFKFSWPSISLPHFSIKPAGWKIGDLLKGSIPSLGISWYAKGGVFERPTLLSGRNGLSGVGEAGAEAVLPIEILREYIREEMEAVIGSWADALVSAIEDLAGRPICLQVNGRTIMTALAGDADNALGTRQALAGRGLSL